ncbi:MAG: hypothetical protein EZS28_047130, partial [Streblomastix strix]
MEEVRYECIYAKPPKDEQSDQPDQSYQQQKNWSNIEALLIWRVISEQQEEGGFLRAQDISLLALLPQQDVNAFLYKLFKLDLVYVQEVPQTAEM